MVLDVNVRWIKEGSPQERIIRIDSASEIFESTDITTEEFWELVEKENVGSYELHEELMIDVDRRYIEMDGQALRFDWYSIKEKITKLRQHKWHITQSDPEIVKEYPWLKEEMPQPKVGQGWHGESERHSIKKKVGNIRKKYKNYNQNLNEDYTEGEPYGFY